MSHRDYCVYELLDPAERLPFFVGYGRRPKPWLTLWAYREHSVAAPWLMALDEPPALGGFYIGGLALGRESAAMFARFRIEWLRDDLGLSLPYNHVPNGKKPIALKRVLPDGTVERYRSYRDAGIRSGVSRAEVRRCVASASLDPYGAFWTPDTAPFSALLKPRHAGHRTAA